MGVRRVKSTDGADLIVLGSSTLTSLLLDQGLVDEVVLMVYPVLLGRGKRFFSDRVEARELTLASMKATPTGVLINTYRRVARCASRPSARLEPMAIFRFSRMTFSPAAKTSLSL